MTNPSFDLCSVRTKIRTSYCSENKVGNQIFFVLVGNRKNKTELMNYEAGLGSRRRTMVHGSGKFKWVSDPKTVSEYKPEPVKGASFFLGLGLFKGLDLDFMSPSNMSWPSFYCRRKERTVVVVFVL